MSSEAHNIPINIINPSSIPMPTGKGTEIKKGDEGKLRKACADFEAIFISQMLKMMRQTIPQSGFLDGGSQQNMYLSLFDEELSKSIAQKGGMGLGKMLYENIIKRTGNNRFDPLAFSPDSHGHKGRINIKE